MGLDKVARIRLTLEVFLNISDNRIFRKLEKDMSETQMGFRNSIGLREGLFGVSVLFQRFLDFKTLGKPSTKFITS